MEPAREVTPDVTILPSYFPIPGFGLVPVNAFLLKSAEPVLVDTGVPVESEQFIAALESVIDPEDIRWIWLTHPDQDHLGSLHKLLDRAPRIRVVTTFLGLGYMSLFNPLPMDRVFLLNPGERISVGDRELICLRPPSFDNPATTQLYDTKSSLLFSSDCFGAIVQEAAQEADAIPPDRLREGQMMWSRVDAPWLHKVDKGKFGAELKALEELRPAAILSSHLPPAHNLLAAMLETLAEVPDSEPLTLPNQAQLEVMLAQLTHGAAPN